MIHKMKPPKIVVAAMACLLLFDCSGQKQPQIMAGVDECAHCKMVISKLNEACGYFIGNEFIAFDSPVCLLRKYEKRKKSDQELPTRIYFADYNSSRFVPADSISFLITSHIPTVMDAGVICFADRNAARSLSKFPDEKVTDWTGFFTQKGTPDRKVELIVSSSGIQPDVIVLNKNELAELVFKNQNLTVPESFYLKGYEEIGTISVLPDRIPVKIRLWARLPGAGFPLIRKRDEKPVGMIKVVGAHTMDEEVM